MGKMKKCKKCLLEVDEDTAVCPRCDAELIPKEKPARSKIRKCHKCLLEVSESAENCPRCAAKLGPEAEAEGKGKSYVGMLLLILFAVILFTIVTTVVDYLSFSGSDAPLSKALVISKDAKDVTSGAINVLKDQGWGKRPASQNAIVAHSKDVGIVRDSKFTRSDWAADPKSRTPGMLAISTFPAGAINRDIGIIRESLGAKKKWALPPRMQGLGGFGGSGGLAISTFSSNTLARDVGISTSSADALDADVGIVRDVAGPAIIKNDKESKDKLIARMKKEGLHQLGKMGIDDIGYEGDTLHVYVDLRFEDLQRSEQEDAVFLIENQWLEALGQESGTIVIRQFGTGKKLEKWGFKE